MGDKFITVLRRLEQDFGIAGKDLITFMRDSVAVRLENETFMDGLLIMRSKLSPGEVAQLIRNAFLVSRLSPRYACSILNITRHLDSHGLDGAKTLKALIGKTPFWREGSGSRGEAGGH